MILLLQILFAGAYAQDKIDSIYIYSYFNGRGLTTNGAYYDLRNIKKIQTKKVLLPANQVERLNEILKTTKKRRHHQTKLGNYYLFGEFYTQNKLRDFFIASNVLLDMTNHSDYWIKNKDDEQWMETFLKKIKE